MPRKRIRKSTHSLAKTLKVSLPGGNLPIEIKLITLFTATGGLGLVGGIFGDVVRPAGTHLPTYLIRLMAGIAMVAVSYGLIKRNMWSLWLYAFVVAVGLFINPIAAIIPLIAVVYLFFRRDIFS